MSNAFEDLAKLDSIDPEVVLSAIEQRHAEDNIYTRNGAVLIAVNPYKQLGIYVQNRLDLYKASMSLELVPPHVYAVAAAAHRTMISGGRNQAVIISGESGSGKTESASFIMRYLRFVSNATQLLEHRISSAQPLTEAFGCAKTIRNDNSSRFGKFLMLHFDQSARIQGAQMSTYLLEKSRVSHINRGERSYHIFYCLIRAADASLRSRLRLASADPAAFRYLENGETADPSGTRSDTELFGLVEEALRQQDFSEQSIGDIWALLAGILHLGSVLFDESHSEAAQITPASSKSLESCEHLLGIQGGTLSRALTKRKIKARLTRAHFAHCCLKSLAAGREFVEQELSLVAANDNRDALAKAIYSKLFDRIIEQINAAFAAGGEPYELSEMRTIGIVDIFGFEVFGLNSLEQLCINFANEKLQALFTKSVFKETIRAYEEDGIDAAEITFTDNAELLAVFEQPQSGLLSILTEECLLPKGTDTAFAEKLHSAHRKSSVVTNVKGSSTREGFGVQHFAGLVNYSTSSWLDKNKDPLNGDLVVLMQFSATPMLKELFTMQDQEPVAGRKFKSTKFKGVIDTFRAQLADLMGVLESSELHFVRCFKPNDEKRSDYCDRQVISRQLHTSGVLDALRVARTGFPDRMPFAEFFTTYAAILKGRSPAAMEAMPPKQRAGALLEMLRVDPALYRLGRERVFLGLGVLANLRTRRLEAMAAVAVVIQAAARGLIARTAVRELKRARKESLAELLAATQHDDVDALQAAVVAAKAVGVDLMVEGRVAFARAEQRLHALQLAQRELIIAKQELEAALALHDLPRLRTAMQTAAALNMKDEALLHRGQLHLKTLEDEEVRRQGEERLRREEEARLGALASKEKAAAQRAMAEERARREQQERRVAEAAAAEEAALAERISRASLGAVQPFDEVDEEAAAQRAMEEEAQQRQQALLKLERDGVAFESETEDVLEYAIYLGMLLSEDLDLLWIADRALQAEDPEGWDQYESPAGDLYYMHEVTKQVLWQHPLDYQYQQLYLEEKKKRSGGRASTHLMSPDAAPPGRAAAPPNGAARHPPPTAGPGLTPSSDDQLRGVLQRLLGTRHSNLRALLTEPACCDEAVKGFVMRYKSRIGGTRFDFYMSISKSEDMYCFTARKHSAGKGCHFTIALDQEESKRSSKAAASESFVGTVRSDRKSTEYYLYDEGYGPDSKEARKGGALRRELLYVNFMNSLRNKDPGMMHVLVPEVRNGVPAEVRPASAAAALGERLFRGDLTDIALLKNREPKYNPESNMYQLDFVGRATLPSCKNIQLHRKDGDPTHVSFLMGKVEDNKFNVDFKGPFSCLQAFAFALVVFDNSSGGLRAGGG